MRNEEWLTSPCPIRSVLTRFGDSWSFLLLMTLGQEERMRFNALRRAVPEISQKMLAQTLRILACDGYVERTVVPVIPPQVEYSLTPLGHSLLVPLTNLANWAEKHRQQIVTSRQEQNAA
ncbi:winged helix-turn-helix transcriptional regulator [Rhizorhapis suberifaciens]|uniref:DNA-binding HxlR family transcriptional regulator n=1 Tax=Rhizorhapis suberifaciens TaxID=13656 RepID=A0A840HQT9_9SPHN|nr:helix-turn-helix domain-containing protein [Rhizorhapis suberifaciens]MBB4640009.1 DNA-binding HxlR family transcriptional regulator [Rhizorhapis suberifaciens]